MKYSVHGHRGDTSRGDTSGQRDVGNTRELARTEFGLAWQFESPMEVEAIKECCIAAVLGAFTYLRCTPAAEEED